MKILYGVQMHGQGHLNRSAALIRRLRERGHHVSVVTSGQDPPAYAATALGPFTHTSTPSYVLSDGRLDVPRTAVRMFSQLPARGFGAASLARRLARERFDLVISDLEPISAWAAGMARVPAAGVSPQFRITRTRAPRSGSVRERWPTALGVKACGVGLSSYFAVSFSPLQPSMPDTSVVGPIVGDDVRGLTPRDGGFFLAYLYTYSEARITRALAGDVPFRVYGMDREGTDGNITWCRTGREPFIRDLAACEGVVLNGSFQGVCEAAVLGKPVLSIPFSQLYEERFCAEQVEAAGLGTHAPRLDREVVRSFCRATRPVTPAPMGDGAEQVIRELGL